MKTLTKEVHFCDYCNKLYQVKSACVKHEPHCKENPKNKHKCFEFCKHLKKTKGGYDRYEEHYYPTEFLCEKKECTMWSYIAERRDIQHCADERMPLECESYEPFDFLDGL